MKLSRLMFFFKICSTLQKNFKAIYGFSPSGSESSLQTYLLYYTTLGEIIFDPSTSSIAPPNTKITVTFAKFFVGMWILGLYSSFLYSYNYKFYETKIPMNSLDHSLFDIMSLPHLANNFLLAGMFAKSHILAFYVRFNKFELTILSFQNYVTVLLQSYLTVFTHPLRLAVNILFKSDIQHIMDNAMLTARSPSEFWGVKWNFLVHGVLKVSYEQCNTQFFILKFVLNPNFYKNSVCYIIHSFLIIIF